MNRRLPWGEPAALGACLLGLAAWVLAVDPVWETPDDPVQAMSLLGYGLATEGVPLFTFGNVAWGGLVRALEPLAGLQAYGVATLAGLALAAVGTWLAVRRAGASGWVAGAALALLFARPLALPQYSVLAGMLAVAGVLLVARAEGEGRAWRDAAGWGLLLLASWIRLGEALGVLLLAAPWLPWRVWAASPRRLVAPLAAVLVGLATAVADAHAHGDPAWGPHQAYYASIGLQVHDWSLGPWLAERPALLARHGLSANDLALLRATFVDDPALFAMGGLRWGEPGLEPGAFAAANAAALARGFAAWADRALWPLAFVALGLGLLGPARRRHAFGWAMLLGFHLVLAVSGRPMPPRLLLPWVALLAALAVLDLGARREGPPPRRLGLVLVLAAGLALAQQWRAHLAREPAQQAFRAAAATLDPAWRYVVWADFPFELTHRVLERDARMLALRVTPLGFPAHFPHVRAADRAGTGLGWRERLLAGQAVRLVASEASLALLARYFEEHHRRPLLARSLEPALGHELRLGPPR